ncbi:hypothetical protein [Streptococcus agalactiae]|uniref:hypothetical protein n=1 Tax=Streptococcus agalactiae TaxID=1311 RepID=UPI003C77DE1C
MKKYIKWLIPISTLGMILGGCQINNEQKSQSNEVKNSKQSEVKKDKKMPQKEQIDYLKEHEQEIIDYVKSQNKKIESVQFDWSSMKVEQIGNGTPQGGGYNLSLSGKFNNLDNTELSVDFYLEHEEDVPNIKDIGMLNQPMIDRGNFWDIYGD